MWHFCTPALRGSALCTATAAPRGLHAPEAGGEMHRHVLMALLKAVVLADVVQVVPADDNGALHLHLGNHTWVQEEER